MNPYLNNIDIHTGTLQSEEIEIPFQIYIENWVKCSISISISIVIECVEFNFSYFEWNFSLFLFLFSFYHQFLFLILNATMLYLQYFSIRKHVNLFSFMWHLGGDSKIRFKIFLINKRLNYFSCLTSVATSRILLHHCKVVRLFCLNFFLRNPLNYWDRSTIS